MQYIEPNKHARHGAVEAVTQENLQRVKQDAKEMIRLCFKRHGRHNKAFAIAHPQVSAKPLAFFVTQIGNVYVNPTITERDGMVALRSEGCMTFPDRDNTIVPRHYMVKVKYQTVESVETGEWHEQTFRDIQAQIMQHEIDHLNGIHVYLYDEESRHAYKQGDHEKVIELTQAYENN